MKIIGELYKLTKYADAVHLTLEVPLKQFKKLKGNWLYKKIELKETKE